MHRGSKLIGYLPPLRASPFLTAPCGVPDDAVVCPREKAASSALPLCVDFRVRGRSGSARIPQNVSTSRGISSPIATSAVRVHPIGQASNPTYVSSSVFLTLSTIFSPLDLASLFHLTATCGVPPSGAFPAAKPEPLIETPCPPVLFRPSPIANRGGRYQLVPVLLQGLDPCSNP